MTECEWLVSNDPAAMLRRLFDGPLSHPRLQGRPNAVSDRKLRLWASACCRDACRITNGVPAESLRLCDLSDEFADGNIPYAELQDFLPSHPDCSWPLRYEDNVHTTVMNTINAKQFLPGQAALLRDIIGNPWQPVMLPWKPTWSNVFGAGRTCSWLTPTVLDLAQVAYAERTTKACPDCKGRGALTWPVQRGEGDFDAPCNQCNGSGRIDTGHLDSGRLAVLADALEDVGMAGILLEHLRNEGPHIRGCHVLDVLLGKE